ncbi:MAG: hypothetical protein GC181_13495 [Bacteroidetes bacterium]|nr:hypothetical protein [Bacteroidota bacterium]
MVTIRSLWWKILAALLVLVSMYFGLTTKTGPGLAYVSPERVDASSDFEITITGYNTSFFPDATPKVWLKKKNRLYCANSVTVIDRNHLQVGFNAFEGKVDSAQRIVMTVVVEDEVNGMFLGVNRLEIDQSDTLKTYAAACTLKPEKLSAIQYSFPYRTTLYETIRNLHFHVPMWFSMITVLFLSFLSSILFLNKSDVKYDHWANAFAATGLVFGIAGIITGAFWARFTWGTFWTADPKLNGAAVAVLMYIAYQILRSSIEDEDKLARIAAIYNILAFPIYIVLIIVLPTIAEFSLHPGSGDSVGFKDYDLDSNLRMVFYPSVMGWVLTSVWIATLVYRTKRLEFQQTESEINNEEN